jgi:hypothetical protein
MPHPGGMEGADALGDLLGAAERAVALRRPPHVGAVAVAQCRRGGFERLFVAVVQPGEQQVPGAEPLDLAPGSLGRGGDLAEPGAEGLGRHDVGDPAVAEPPGAGERRVGAAADPDRRPARLARRRLQRQAAEAGIMAALMVDGLAAQQRAQQRDCLGQARAAFLYRHAARLVLLGKFAADPDPEDQPALAQMIQRRDHLGDRHRMAQGQQIDPDAQQQAAADHRRLRQHQQRVEDRRRVPDVVGDPDRIEAAAIDLADDGLQLVDFRQPGPDRRLGAPMDRLDANLQMRVER